MVIANTNTPQSSDVVRYIFFDILYNNLNKNDQVRLLEILKMYLMRYHNKSSTTANGVAEKKNDKLRNTV